MRWVTTIPMVEGGLGSCRHRRVSCRILVRHGKKRGLRMQMCASPPLYRTASDARVTARPRWGNGREDPVHLCWVHWRCSFRLLGLCLSALCPQRCRELNRQLGECVSREKPSVCYVFAMRPPPTRRVCFGVPVREAMIPLHCSTHSEQLDELIIMESKP